MDGAAQEFWMIWNRIGAESKAEERSWIEQLQADGIKAAHPDDGWVNRERNEVHFAYPQFNDGVTVGDRIALGDARTWRVVTVTGLRDDLLGIDYYNFE